jgi:phage shock protein A
MATNKNSVLSQLQSVGEDAVARITKSPAARSALQKGTQLKDRAGKTLSGLEGIEERLAAVEKRLAALERKAKPASSRSRSTSKSSRSTKSAAKSTESTTPTTSEPRPSDSTTS